MKMLVRDHTQPHNSLSILDTVTMSSCDPSQDNPAP